MQRTTIAAFALFAVAAVALAGPLNPPAGPIAPTNKTLSEVEPRIAINSTNAPGDGDSRYIIAASGSYYLPFNVSIVGQSAIHIGANARDVTIDLMGHTISCSILSTAISAAPSALSRTVTIRNGSIRSAGGIGTPSGIALADISGVVVEDIRVEGTLFGIITGNDASIRRCDIRSIQTLTVDAAGIEVGSGSIVEDCRVVDIAGSGINPGIRTGSSSVVRDCVITQATGGERGIDAGSGGIVERNVIRCGHDITPFTGIDSGGASIIRGNLIIATASATVTGITATTGTTIQSNTFSACDTGISLGGSSDCLVTGNHFRLSTTPVSAVNVNSHIIGPTIGSGGAAASNNPHANYVQ
jgi:parallel beta-helix repeat protein